MRRQSAVVPLFISIVLFQSCISPEPPFEADTQVLTDAALERDIMRILNSFPYQSGHAFFSSCDRVLNYGKPAIPILESKGLSHPAPAARLAAAYLLGKFGDHASVDRLRELEYDPDAACRIEAASSRLDLGDWSVMPILIRGLRDEKRTIRYKCFEILSVKTGLTFGYDWASRKEDRDIAADRWQAWWEDVYRGSKNLVTASWATE